MREFKFEFVIKAPKNTKKDLKKETIRCLGRYNPYRGIQIFLDNIYSVNKEFLEWGFSRFSNESFEYQLTEFLIFQINHIIIHEIMHKVLEEGGLQNASDKLDDMSDTWEKELYFGID